MSLEYYTVDIDLNSTSNGINNIENIIDKETGSSRRVYGNNAQNIFVMYDGNDHVWEDKVMTYMI